MSRTTTAVVGASGLALAALFTFSATAALADPDRAPRSGQVPGMDRMHELMTERNPGMDRMHELMTERNPGMDRMHELMTERNPGMDRMHERMTEGPR